MGNIKRDNALLARGSFGEQFAASRFYFIGEFLQAFAPFVFGESTCFDVCHAFANVAPNAAELLLGDRDVDFSHDYLAPLY